MPKRNGGYMRDAGGRRLDEFDIAARYRRGKRNIALPATATTLPTVTVGSTATTYSNAVTYNQNSSRAFNFLGADVQRSATVTNFSSPSSLVPQNANSFQAWAMSFVSDAPTFDLSVAGFGGSFRILVDGQVAVPTTAIPSVSGSLRYIKVDWAGVRALRSYRVEWDNGFWGSLLCSAVDTVRSTSVNGPRVIFIGDSYTEGTGTNRYLNWAWQAGKLLGWDDTWASGSGGTGYLYTPGSGKVKYRDRFTACVSNHSPDIIVFSGGRNDGAGGYTPAQVGAEAQTLLQKARTENPSALLVICGNFTSGNPDTYATDMCAALQAAAMAVEGTLFLNPLGTRPIINGTGRVGGATGNGNADYATSSDTVHPTPYGHDLLGEWFAAEMAFALPNA